MTNEAIISQTSRMNSEYDVKGWSNMSGTILTILILTLCSSVHPRCVQQLEFDAENLARTGKAEVIRSSEAVGNKAVRMYAGAKLKMIIFVEHSSPRIIGMQTMCSALGSGHDLVEILLNGVKYSSFRTNKEGYEGKLANGTIVQIVQFSDIQISEVSQELSTGDNELELLVKDTGEDGVAIDLIHLALKCEDCGCVRFIPAIMATGNECVGSKSMLTTLNLLLFLLFVKT